MGQSIVRGDTLKSAGRGADCPHLIDMLNVVSTAFRFINLGVLPAAPAAVIELADVFLVKRYLI